MVMVVVGLLVFAWPVVGEMVATSWSWWFGKKEGGRENDERSPPLYWHRRAAAELTGACIAPALRL